MKKPNSAKQLAIDISARSLCSVQVGAAIEDNNGILAWGWNSVGGGFGMCAERHAILRANKRRLPGARIYIASIRGRNGKVVPSKPCESCQRLIDKFELQVTWRQSNGQWCE